MKTKEEVYTGINDKFLNSTGIDVERGTVIDSFFLASAEMISKAHEEIDNNKTPHIYTSLEGSKIDDAAILCGLTREPDESDKNFLYRLLKWNVSNKASNTTAIETALMNCVHCSHATYVPFVFGCGTAAIYIIPKEMSLTGKELAIAEVKRRLKDVVSPSSYIEYIIPEIVSIKLTLLIKAQATDIGNIKSNINNNVLKYINGIAPGSYLEVGEINRIGLSEANVTYFNVGHIFVDGEETGSLSILQKVDSKFLITENDINWLEVE